jgi:SP family general alpha glucoside:H+ symporter-like MFS transporter
MAAPIILEGYETALMPNFFSYKPFRHLYGKIYTPGSAGAPEAIITPEWQSAILGSGAAAQLIGLLLAPKLANRFGYRHTAMIGLG